MPYSLRRRNVLVTGGSRGLGALLCNKFAAQGCNVAVNYVISKDRADEVAKNCADMYGVKTAVIQADACLTADNIRLVKETVAALGGLDIIIANAGWTRFSSFENIYDMSHEEWNKCWAANVMSHLQLMQQAAPVFNTNADGGVYLISSSVAGISTAGSSMAYSVSKAAGLHLMKCLAFTQGPKIRVNAVLPGLLLTEWGLNYPQDVQEATKQRAALKKETNLDDCADAYVAVAKISSMTGQQIQVDAGLIIR